MCKAGDLCSNSDRGENFSLQLKVGLYNNLFELEHMPAQLDIVTMTDATGALV